MRYRYYYRFRFRPGSRPALIGVYRTRSLFRGAMRGGGGPAPGFGGLAHPYFPDEESKSCCGLVVSQAVSIRWFIIMIAFVGLCCTLVGTVLGAVKTNSSEYVTITLLMIGVGIVLITVSGVAWHLTSRDAPCRVMLGLTSQTDANRSTEGGARRFVARMAPNFGRPNHPYAPMMYPDFQYRPPPPSYQASMQEYRLRLLLFDRQQNQMPHMMPPFPRHSNIPSRGLSSGLMVPQEDNYNSSRPPSYRSRDGSGTPTADQDPSTNPAGIEPVHHSRDPSCLSYLSQESIYSSHQGSISSSRQPKGSVKSKDAWNHGALTIGSGSKMVKDGNTVTIVQSTDCSQVIDSDAVVVTVSGSQSRLGGHTNVRATQPSHNVEMNEMGGSNQRRNVNQQSSRVSGRNSSEGGISVLAHL